MISLYRNIISKIGIRWKLVMIFSLLISLSGVIIGYTSYYYAEKIVIQQIRYQLSMQAEDWKRLTDSYVEEVKSIEALEDTIMRTYLANMSSTICNWFEFTDELNGGHGNTPSHIQKKIYDYIARIEVGKSGYVWLLGGEGRNKGTFIVSKDRLQDGENQWEMKDVDGRKTVQEIYQHASKMDTPFIVNYHWGKDSLGKPLRKIAAVKHYKPWNIYIGVSAYYKDYLKVEMQMKERLKNKISEQIIGKTGYIYVIDGEGEDKGHYIVSQKRSRDGENIWDAKDASGRYFIRDIVNKGKKTPSEAYIITYPWQNPGEEKAYEKIAAITYVPEWEWVIGASAYFRDFLDPVVSMRKRAIRITYISAIASIITAFLVGSYYARTLTIPLRKLTKMADKMGKGQVNQDQEHIKSSAKEIITLVKALEKAKETQLQLDSAEKEKTKLISELEAKNMELERFTYTVSHDLRTPLVTIKGFLGVFKEDFKEGNHKDLNSHIRRIENAADTMQTLLSDLLELSRIGRMVNPNEKVDLNQLLKIVLEMLSAPIKEKDVQIIVQENLPTIFADKQRMMEVFQNLIENSIKYMGEQSAPEINIGCNTHENKNTFYIKDNGIGIDVKYKEKVFGLFDQLNNNAEGSGVGLALVKRIIEFHNGEVWFESEGKDKGTTFFFTIGEQTQNI